MTHLESVSLGGEYALGQYLGEDEEPSSEGTFYRATSRSGERVLVKMLPDHPADGDQQLLLWRRTAQLQHPNLLRLLDCGRDPGASQGEGYLYAVFEWPDDHLSAALEQGALSEAEARDLLTAALDGLRYLHTHGLVHGTLDAEHVMAVENVIKLATDNLHQAGTGEFTRAHDIGSLGALLHQVLTGSKVGDGAKLVEIGEPFAGMIRKMVEAEPAGGRSALETPGALRAAAPGALYQALSPIGAREATANGDALRSRPGVEREVPVPRSLTARAERSKPPLWAWPVSLAVVIGCIAMVVYTPAPKPNAAPATVRTPLPAAPVVSPAMPPRSPTPRGAASPHQRTVWRVVAYTYNGIREAQKQVQSINRKWPGLGAEIFTPKGANQPPYLVALGGRMDRLEAARLLQKARSRGLPRDTFMLNFSD
jgi:hypothetical protein